MTGQVQTMFQIPKGKSVEDMLPAFSGVTQYVAVGAQTQEACACCEKPFTPMRQPQLGFRLYPVISPFPVAYEYHICRKCETRYRSGGAKRNRVLAAVQTFMTNRT